MRLKPLPTEEQHVLATSSQETSCVKDTAEVKTVGNEPEEGYTYPQGITTSGISWPW